MRCYFHKKILQVSIEWRLRIESKYLFNSFSFKSIKLLAYSNYLRQFFIYSVVCCPSLNWIRVVVKVYITLVNFFYKTPVEELG